jgi:hypothetical protein
VREYDRTLGDCWDVPHGLAIGWKYHQHDPEPLPPQPESTEQQQRQNKKKKQSRKGRPLQKLFQKLRLCRPFKPASESFPPRLAKASLAMPRRKHYYKSGASLRDSSSTSAQGDDDRFDKNPTTSWQRYDILKEFGYSSQELEQAESQRERTKFERYLEDSMTCRSSS